MNAKDWCCAQDIYDGDVRDETVVLAQMRAKQCVRKECAQVVSQLASMTEQDRSEYVRASRLDPDKHCCGEVVEGKCRWCGRESEHAVCDSVLEGGRKRVSVSANAGELRIPCVRWECRCGGHKVVLRGDIDTAVVQAVMRGRTASVICPACGVMMDVTMSRLVSGAALKPMKRKV